ncbi:hypothetical protein [Solibacillus cecembensis]|uniref:hypothetical protein n=1 Tax=Solibacillus cecembensis TaxID=459347 RepID=UPI003D00FF61
MIDIVEHVVTALVSTKLPVLFNSVPTGSNIPNQYITFLEVTSSAALEAADREFETKRLIQVNVWSKGNYYQLVEDVKKLLESADYERTLEYDNPKSDGDSHFNKVLQFAFFDEY